VRNLFLLLVLLNLGVLAWFAWVEPEPAPPVAYSGPGITLLRELDPEAPILMAARSQLPETRAASGFAVADPTVAELAAVPVSADPEVAPAPDSTQPVTSCVAVGPFDDAAQADVAVATLNDRGIAASLRVDQDEIWEGFWVFVAGLPSTERANAVLAELAASGIADAYVIPNSDSGILISLGVFSDVTRAGNQAERAGRFGLAATITERRRIVDSLWIELEFEGEESQALAVLQEPGVISRLEQRVCRRDVGA
jgi:hypothetical protein